MIRMDSARQWWTGFTVFVALLLLPGCMNTQYTAAETEPTPAGFVEQTKQGLILQPAPLYGSHQLSIGAVQPAGKSPFLLLCDEGGRAIDTQRPLILYLDGDYRSLPWSAGAVSGMPGCQPFETDIRTLNTLASVERAMLRVYFTNETVEHRISGTSADYFSRPKMFGPQRSIGRFVEAVQENYMSSGIANGGLPTANTD